MTRKVYCTTEGICLWEVFFFGLVHAEAQAGSAALLFRSNGGLTKREHPRRVAGRCSLFVSNR